MQQVPQGGDDGDVTSILLSRPPVKVGRKLLGVQLNGTARVRCRRAPEVLRALAVAALRRLHAECLLGNCAVEVGHGGLLGKRGDGMEFVQGGLGWQGSGGLGIGRDCTSQAGAADCHHSPTACWAATLLAHSGG